MSMYEGDEAGVLKGKKCVRSGRCCKSNPGWFGPGEAEKVAEFLGMSMGRFVNEFLVVDHIDLDVGRVEVFAPLKLDMEANPISPAGEKTGPVYRHQSGACVFYDPEERACTIHPVRPIECRHYSCINPPERNMSREAIAEKWLQAHLDQKKVEEQAEEEGSPPKKKSFFKEI